MEQEETARLVFWASFPSGTPRETCRSVALRAERAALALLPREQSLLVQIAPDFCVLAIEFDEEAAASALPHVMRGQFIAHAAALSVGNVAVNGFGPGYSAGFEGGASFAVRVAGYRYDAVRSIASSLAARFRAHPRMAAVDIDRSGALHEGMYEVTGTPDRQRLVRAGVPVAGLAEAINEGRSGVLLAGPGREGREAPPFVVLGDGADAPALSDVEDTMLRGAHGASGRLSEFLAFRVRRTPARITRERQHYVQWMTLEYKGPEQDGARIVDEVLRTSMIPPGYSAERHHARGALAGDGVEPALLIGGVSLLVSWMIAAAAYESLALPALVLLTVPFSLIGIFVAFPLVGLAFGRGGVVAAILLVGIVGANAVVLVDRLRPVRPGCPPTHDQIIDGARERLQPILVTAGATFAGVVPLLVTEPVGTLGFTFAFGLAAGLVSGTLLTLVVVPVVMSAVTHGRSSP
jgi:HAE1 family hydrophobic/amphiphilic exporter-1